MLDADSLVLALGQDTDLSLLDGLDDVEMRDGVVVVDGRMMTGRPGVFAGGDMVPDQRSVTVGIGHGRRAAEHIDDWLAGRAPAPEPERDLAEFAMLNTWYYADAPRAHRPLLEQRTAPVDLRRGGAGPDESTALYEARRCMSCGNCFSCDNCFGVCPDNAVHQDRHRPGRYEIDLDYCKGCGLCVSECPSGRDQMVPEEI